MELEKNTTVIVKKRISSFFDVGDTAIIRDISKKDNKLKLFSPVKGEKIYPYLFHTYLSNVDFDQENEADAMARAFEQGLDLF